MGPSKRILVSFICLLAIGAGKQKSASDSATLVGAWLQTDLKWEAAPLQGLSPCETKPDPAP